MQEEEVTTATIASNSSLMENRPPTSSSSSSLLLGGDFAGLSATFNPTDGSFIPIPERLIPEELLKWGQEPKCLEVLVSEEDGKKNSGGMEAILGRKTITVFPAVGCKIENMDTSKEVDEVPLESACYGDKNSSVVGLQYRTGGQSFRLETIFGLKNEGYDRMRVILDLVRSQRSEEESSSIPAALFTPKAPIVLVLERRTSEVSSGGTIADGGGLDAQTVFTLLGPELSKSRTFVEDKPSDLDHLSSVGDDGSTRHVVVKFPGNISITYGSNEPSIYYCGVSHVEDGVRRIVTRDFKFISEDEMDLKVASFEEVL